MTIEAAFALVSFSVLFMVWVVLPSRLRRRAARRREDGPTPSHAPSHE